MRNVRNYYIIFISVLMRPTVISLKSQHQLPITRINYAFIDVPWEKENYLYVEDTFAKMAIKAHNWKTKLTARHQQTQLLLRSLELHMTDRVRECLNSWLSLSPEKWIKNKNKKLRDYARKLLLPHPDPIIPVVRSDEKRRYLRNKFLSLSLEWNHVQSLTDAVFANCFCPLKAP